ncbi:MAG: ATP-binding cassette domain-containing protein [Bacteroidia bacterium]|nr:ATP-binding cassette domain-containing protein [Bacteroidia bacterium]
MEENPLISESLGIEVLNLRKSFGDKEVLKGVDFLFEPGKVNMIIGASGSGKSVMLKTIVGLHPPDSGEVLYNGENFFDADTKHVKALRTNIGMLFQGSALFDSMTVEENVAFPIQMFTRLKPAEIKERVNSCLARVNLPDSNNRYPSEISGGMKKRVGIARAIAMNPKFLFVDEPNSGLDPLTASVIDKLIQELTFEFNMTTIVVSHDMNSVMNIGHKIMFLFEGQKEWEGTNKEILYSENPNLEKFIFVSDLIKR